MRKLFTLTFFTVLALGFCKPQTASAQITGFVQTSLSDSIDTYCNLPATRMVAAHTVVQGTIVPGDSVFVIFNWGDASSDTMHSGAAVNINAYYTHPYTFAGTYTAQVIFLDTATGVSDTAYTPSVTINDTCANVTGRLYADNNANCIYDGGDVAFTNDVVKITNTTTMAVYYTWTDNTGTYNIDLPAGFTYDITKPYVWGYSPSCPVSGIQTVTVTGGSYIEDLAYQCTAATDIDLSVTGSASNFRPGFNRTMWVLAQSNNACNPANTTVTLTLDPQLSYTSTVYGPTPTSVVGNVLTWTVTGIDQLNSFSTLINVLCDSVATLGDTLCNTVTVDTPATFNDPDTTNNVDNICAVVSNAYDPNNKGVMPKGTGTPGYISTNTMLSYVVNFQNTGNDTAINVTIKDTLDANVDINSLHFLTSSHPVSISTLPGNILVFRFDNIMLPDSNVNEPASHGFVMYSIKPKNALTPLSTINNTASIYFDFNTAVVTNTTLNTISPVSVQRISKGNMSATVYPNPANDKVTVEMNGKFMVTVYDMIGRPVTSQNADSKTSINTAALPQGMYMIRISANGNEMMTKINIQH